MKTAQLQFMFKPDKEKRKKYQLDAIRDGTISFLLDTEATS